MAQLHQAHQLAILIAAPHPGESAMYNDMTAIAQALEPRGFSADQIFCLHGRLDRPLVVAFLRAVNRSTMSWTDGSVFLHISGHGTFHGDTAEDARPGLLFGDSEDVVDDDRLFWDELLLALTLPAGVRLVLLPDH